MRKKKNTNYFQDVKRHRVFLEFLEGLVALTLVVGIFIQMVNIWKSFFDFGLNISLYTIIDEIILLILVIDILRTLLKGMYAGSVDVIIIIEVAMIAVLREIILSEIKSVSWPTLIAYGIVFGILFVSWCQFRKRNK